MLPINGGVLILTDSAKNKTATVLKRNTEARSSNHCCSGNAINTTYFDCVFVDLVTQHAMRKRHIGLSQSTIFFDIIS